MRRSRRWMTTLLAATVAVAGVGLGQAPAAVAAGDAHRQDLEPARRELLAELDQRRRRPAARGSAPADGAPRCGMEVTADITFTRDLECGPGVALFVTASDVTIDLDGHTLSGGSIVAGSPTGVTGITIEDGTVRDVDDPAALWLGATSGATVERLSVRNSPGWGIETGWATTIRNSHFQGNSTAVSMYYGNDTTVVHSRFVDNQRGVTNSGGSGRIADNLFRDNGDGVLLWEELDAADTVVQRNRFVGNDVGLRFDVNYFGQNNRIVGNHFRRNAAAGVLVEVGYPDGLRDSVLEGNHLRGNGGDGVTVRAPDDTGLTLTRNRALHNGGLGFNVVAPAAVHDGGANLAVRNEDPRQCVGLSCAPGGSRGSGRGTARVAPR